MGRWGTPTAGTGFVANAFTLPYTNTFDGSSGVPSGFTAFNISNAAAGAYNGLENNQYKHVFAGNGSVTAKVGMTSDKLLDLTKKTSIKIIIGTEIIKGSTFRLAIHPNKYDGTNMGTELVTWSVNTAGTSLSAYAGESWQTFGGLLEASLIAVGTQVELIFDRPNQTVELKIGGVSKATATNVDWTGNIGYLSFAGESANTTVTTTTVTTLELAEVA